MFEQRLDFIHWFAYTGNFPASKMEDNVHIPYTAHSFFV